MKRLSKPRLLEYIIIGYFILLYLWEIRYILLP